MFGSLSERLGHHKAAGSLYLVYHPIYLESVSTTLSFIGLLIVSVNLKTIRDVSRVVVEALSKVFIR